MAELAGKPVAEMLGMIVWSKDSPTFIICVTCSLAVGFLWPISVSFHSPKYVLMFFFYLKLILNPVKRKFTKNT
jgi:hypothetical protein